MRQMSAFFLTKRIPKEDGEDDESYLTRVTKWIGDHIGGYSIFHVSGRFKAGTNLLSREQAAVRENSGSRYLVDETTAVTRFFFPCSGEAEADKVRYFFDALFVQSIIQLINAEDEIWMIESGLQDKVHIWKAGDDDDDGSEEYAKETAEEGEEE